MVHIVLSFNIKRLRTILKTWDWLLDLNFLGNVMVIDVSAGGAHRQGFVLLSFPIT